MTLAEALNGFVAECNQDPRLREMNRDWSRQIAIVATGHHGRRAVWLKSQEGILTSGEGPLASPDMEITAPEEMLIDIFSGLLSPTEPYNAGDLLVRGQQDDMMRLDILTLLIWGG
ncbi:MAG: sterol carrier protein [Thermaerobacter sp.]|nr:sterol carrier protein [Thermaerobacter sp.]